MEDVLDESVSEEDLRKFERRYHDSLAQGTVTHVIQFEYAWCLIRSKYPTDVKRGIFLLEDLSKGENESGKRDCIYYLAIGNAKIKEYSKALGYTKVLLQVEPGNRQVQTLKHTIEKRMERGIETFLLENPILNCCFKFCLFLEGLKGMAIIGGAALALGSLIGFGVALARK
uniref:Mitochondrial fission 1 protein n=1 Tax=Daphnia magna TaxID=35525 RepID=A0A0P5VYY0_9CRUS